MKPELGGGGGGWAFNPYSVTVKPGKLIHVVGYKGRLFHKGLTF